MKNKLVVGMVLLTGLGIIAYSLFPRVAYSSSQRMPTASWTLMLYLDGDNAGEWFQLQKFINFAWLGSSINFNMVAQLDRIPGYDDSYDNWTGTRRFYLSAPGLPPTDAHTAVFLGEQNMGDPATLAGFISWAKTNYPARNYALVLCGPTTNYVPAPGESMPLMSFCRDDSSAGDSLSLKELKGVLKQTGGVQFIYFENLDMDIVETAYQVRDYGQAMLGVSHPFDIYWPCNDPFLSSDYPSMTPAELGISFAGCNYDNCDGMCPPKPTQTLFDLTYMDTLAGAIDSLARTMIDAWDTDGAAVRAAARRVMTDLDNNAIPKIYGKFWKGRPRIYFPLQESDFDPAYNGANLDFAANTQWDEFLQEIYHSMTGSWIWQVRKWFRDTQYIGLYSFCEFLTKRTREYYTEAHIPHTFNGGGIAQGFQSAGYYFTYPLPFDFPYFGEIIPAGTPITISVQGFIDLSDLNWHYGYGLVDEMRIAPCMMPEIRTDGSAQPGEDIYITENPDNLVIRWVAETSYEAMPVNVELVLFKDGRIQFNYGSGNTDVVGYYNKPPTIGISKGDRVNYYFSLYDGQTNLENVDSVLFSPIIEPAITVTAPTAGTFFSGTPLTIGWTTTGIDSGTVRLVLKKSDNSAIYELDPAAPYNGSPRTYIIPCAVATGDYYVRVIQGTVSGKSADFRVNKISPCFSVIRPRGGETFVIGERMTIKWVSTGITGNIKINLRKTDGSAVYLVAGSVPSTGTPYTYTIPATVSPGIYHIRIKQGTTTLGDSQPFTVTD